MGLSVLSESAINPVDPFPDPIMADLAALDSLIHQQLYSDAELVRHVGEHIINAGGKRIRPLLVLLMARAFGYEGNRHHVMAAIIEFIHTASLLHDDVVDESTLRRGVESANTLFGNAAAVLVGDFMHTRAFQMMLSLNDMQVMAILADTTNTIAEGEVLQLMKTRHADVDEPGYFRIIHAKTAKLFEAACLLGVVAASGPDRAHKAASVYGRSLGMAFQLVDDSLDYEGNAAMLGKHTGNDLRERKMTLPLIYIAQQGSTGDKRLIAAYIENGADVHFESIMHIVQQSGALEYTVQKAAALSAEALRAIEWMPESDYKNVLVRLCRFAVERKH